MVLYGPVNKDQNSPQVVKQDCDIEIIFDGTDELQVSLSTAATSTTHLGHHPGMPFLYTDPIIQLRALQSDLTVFQRRETRTKTEICSLAPFSKTVSISFARFDKAGLFAPTSLILPFLLFPLLTFFADPTEVPSASSASAFSLTLIAETVSARSFANAS